ncbi:dihydrodipicolinate reductase [Thermodesulfobacteriota bacterium]
MNPIKLMINGIPGNMASVAAKKAIQDDRFEVIRRSLTGPEITQTEFTIESLAVQVLRPDARDRAMAEIIETEGPFITVDYSHPTAVNDNAAFYAQNNLPFVMGTTGGDRKLLEETVASSSIPAVIAPNMAKQIVGFQAMMEYASETFPDLFKGYSLEIKESHQKGKADTSGTARAMIQIFNDLGIPFTENDIQMERDPEIQKTGWGIPEENLIGHAWHTYTLVSDDQTVKFSFTHNVNGRDIYAAGTLDAALFLSKKINEGATGKVFTMIDVLKGV